MCQVMVVAFDRVNLIADSSANDRYSTGERAPNVKVITASHLEHPSSVRIARGYLENSIAFDLAAKGLEPLLLVSSLVI